VVGDFGGHGRRDGLAWYQDNTIFTFSGAGLATVGSVSGVNDPNAQLYPIDYNNDGRDDLAVFYPAVGELHVWVSNGSTFASIGKVRGPGVGAAHTAVTGHFG
jgi:hypothetical protein